VKKVINNGLDIGFPYNLEDYPTALNPATGGCRNLTGSVSEDGLVTVYAVTSTISPSGDQGADPNLVVKVTDRLNATTPSGDDDGGLDHFRAIRKAKSGEVYRGVTWAPQDRDE
jgi:hypothetical protein